MERRPLKLAKAPTLIITVDTYLRRIAWLEYYGLSSEAAALRELATCFVPPYEVDELAIARHMAHLQRYRRIMGWRQRIRHNAH